MSRRLSYKVSTAPSPAPESPALSSSDFPALSAVAEPPTPSDIQQASAASAAVPSDPSVDATEIAAAEKAAEKAARKAAKKAAAAERAAERARVAQEKAAARAVEKERLAKEKAAERERQAALKVEKEKAAKEKAEQEKAEREKAAKERAERERVAREAKAKAAREKEAREKEAAEKAARARVERMEASRREAAARSAKPVTEVLDNAPPHLVNGKPMGAKLTSGPPGHGLKSVEQAPILARMPKKNKPVTKPIKIPKEDHHVESASTIPSAATSDAPQLPDGRGATDNSSNNSRAHSVDMTSPIQPVPVKDLLAELHVQFPWLGLSKHPFFDMSKINPASKVPLEYGPLVHALSALSVGGGSFANNMPSGSIDNAVSSFQQLLETLTQTISDLLRLLPRTTWDDSSSFDGVLRDMLKGDDFLDDGGDGASSNDASSGAGAADGSGKEDEVAALTLALERRARWMEVQLSKLEELHRDINTAAVRAVLSFNDNGWDAQGALPRLGNTLSRFDQTGYVSEGTGKGDGEVTGEVRAMSVEELEKKLTVAKEAAQFVEAELREVMRNLQGLRPTDEYEGHYN